MLLLRPNWCAVAITLRMPTRSASLTAGMFRESAKACTSDTGTFEGVVVIVRRVRANAGRKRNRRVDNSLFRTCSFIYRSGVDIGFEGRSRLPLGLCGAVELRQVEVAPADHG